MLYFGVSSGGVEAGAGVTCAAAAAANIAVSTAAKQNFLISEKPLSSFTRMANPACCARILQHFAIMAHNAREAETNCRNRHRHELDSHDRGRGAAIEWWTGKRRWCSSASPVSTASR